MKTCIDQRSEIRLESNDTIRWKHPGMPEDHKAWAVDRSPSGYGFVTRVESAPRIGDRINIRRFDRDRWDTFEEPFRVTRAETLNDELVVVGCVMD